MGRSYTKKQKKIIATAVLIFAVIFLVVELIGMIPGDSFNGWTDIGIALGLTPSPVTAEGELEVHFLDVENADCILIRQEDKTMLIDAGERKHSEGIISYLEQHGVQKLDLVIATHPHADHIGSMAAVINHFPVERFIMSFMPEKNTPTTSVYVKMLEALDTHSVPVDEAVPGDIYELGTARIQILAPYEETDEANDISVVCRLTFGDRAFMFTGDAGSGVEKQMLDSSYVLTADVLKASHHGSTTGNSGLFVYEVDPEYAVITCGEGNSYGHPHKEVVNLFERQNITFLRSDVHGAIVFRTDGNELTYTTERGQY